MKEGYRDKNDRIIVSSICYFFIMRFIKVSESKKRERAIQGNNSGKFSRLLKDTKFQIQEAKLFPSKIK